MKINNYGDVLKMQFIKQKEYNLEISNLKKKLKYDPWKLFNLKNKINELDYDIKRIDCPINSTSPLGKDPKYQKKLTQYNEQFKKLQNEKFDLIKKLSPLKELEFQYIRAITPLNKSIKLQIQEAYEERLNQIRKKELNEDYLKTANEIIQSKTKISKKDLPNLLLALEEMTWNSPDEINSDPTHSSKNIYLFGSSLDSKFYKDIDIIIDSTKIIENLKNIKKESQINCNMEFKTLFEELGGAGYDGFLEHAEYSLTMPKGNLKNFLKTQLHLTFPKTPVKELPEDFKKIQIMFK